MLPAILVLVQGSFAYMDNIIDPPSSMHQLTPADIAVHATTGEVWAIGDALACVFLTPRADVLYVGKLSVATHARGNGHARTLIDLAATRACALGLPHLELQVRIELTGNQAAFQALGFTEVARTAHSAYNRPTSITYRRPAL